MAPSQLQIKVKALERLIKEHGLYKKEAEEQAKKIEDAKANNVDEYEIKKMNEVLEETKQMAPELEKKVQTTLNGLKKLLEGNVDEDTTTAKEKVKEAEEFLKGN